MTTNARELAELATAYAGGNGLSFRNRIINGDCRIDQRNAGAAVTSLSAYTIDRFQAVGFGATQLAWSLQQDTSAPVDFVNSLKVTITTAETTFGSDFNAVVRQKIEGNNVADLMLGTANAKTVTLSFWVRSSLTGTFGGNIRNSEADRTYVFTYNISSANTWEYKTIIIAGDTTGTWLTTNGIGMDIIWALGQGSDRLGTAGSWTSNNHVGVTGQVQLAGTLNATWQITGVQLEAGSVATPFERRPYGTELALCQRYAYGCNMTMGNTYSTSNSYGHAFKFPTTMRSTPSLASGASFTVNAGSAGTPAILVTTGAPATPDGVFLYNVSNNWTVGAIAGFTGLFSSEL
jgi:hypothetical protein